jgi:uncharacterized protein YyaL (SSP411 family)
MYDGPNASVLHTEKFTYDNAIMVEAYLLYSKILGNSNYLEKAQALGRAMNLTLWNPAAKAYIFLTDPAQSRKSCLVWLGFASHDQTYEADKNPAWLTMHNKTLMD